MGPVASANTYFFLVILLLFLQRLETVPGDCPTPCVCTLEILNCSRVGHPPGLHSVPHPKPAAHPHAFFFLDFTGNSISSIGKQAWEAYPWTEHLVLKGNGLSQVQNTSLEGLLMLTHLDLSCNKIQVIQRKAFEVVPFLRFINFSGNILDRISHGAFEAWHGMQFLLKLDLTHNPLRVIEDDYFYGLPSLKILDLGATEITAQVLMNILRTSLQLKSLFLPKKMSCCLCRMKNDIEVLRDTVKLDCAKECNGRTNLCEKEDPLNKMQKEIIKVLEIRKLNASRTLTIMPEKLCQTTKLNHTRNIVDNPNIADLPPRLLKSVKELNNLKAEDFLQIKWTDKNELTKLYMLANLLQMALKEKISEVERNSQKAMVQNNAESADAKIQNNGHLKKVKRDIWLGEKQQRKETFFRFGRSRREFARALMQHVEQPNSFNVHGRTRLLMKLVDDQDQQSAVSLPTPTQEASESSSTEPISTTTPSLTSPDTVDTTLAGKVIIILKHSNMSETSPESEKTVQENQEEVAPNSQQGIKELFKLLIRWHKSYQSHDTSNNTSKLPADNSEPSLNEVSPDIKLSHGLHWKHHESETTTLHPPLLPTEDDYLLKGDLFEAAMNEKLTTLIPNAPVRNLISHVIRILKMDCSETKVQLACAKLISRTGLLMKLFSQKEKTPSQLKSYLSSVNMTTANPRNLGTPEVVGQEISEYGYGNKLLLAVSVTAVIMITIAIICLIEICSQRSAAKEGTPQEKRTLFGRRKKSAEEASSIVSLLDKPLWLKESDEPLNEVQRLNLADKLQDVETSDEEKAYSWARPPSAIEKTPSRKSSSRKGSQITEVTPVKKPSSRTLTSIVAPEPAPAPPPAEPAPAPPPPPPPPPPPSAPPTSEAEASSKPESSGGDESSKGASSGGSEED